MPTPRLVLASSSKYRRRLLETLGLPFVHASPDIDETPRPNEPAQTLTMRLAQAKARALTERFPDHWIIGSDQVATLSDGSLLSKPGTHRRAVEQLSRCSGQCVTFHTGLALLDAATGVCVRHCEPFEVHFRELTPQAIERYLRTEQPYDCAGSFKMEGLGIALFAALQGRDPNSLIGLPLIALTSLLSNWKYDVLEQAYRNSSRD
ncbi:Maf family protein [Marinobacter sp. X15-166B]|uniref:Maf family protein n=1 Tax=Marinobacter sp. X15-166B TaxID=1897620 RepID=UPI00085C51ED|nr:nucleoside triphosphate pyrophosphatase [Marinobacter sp. X15-166B]OEY67146.1 septum formation protein Maf [Marinobacter sp. X15-166B]